tara:strand:+ start:270 stop:584 length:315 start_codon:yes stop_codon:yes gene_type:complete
MLLNAHDAKKLTKRITRCAALFLLSLPLSAVASDMNPATTAAKKMNNILFGTLGTSICAILIGATFIMAKTGKITWDRFLFVGFCTAGFLGANSIVSLIQGWVV